MNTQKILNRMQEEIIEDISRIRDTTDLLPHVVYVKEDDAGTILYNDYILIKILSNSDTCFPSVAKSCILRNPRTGEEEIHNLSEICIDWLVCIWERYEKQETLKQSKQLWVFLYPVKRFDRNVSDEEIISAYYDDICEIRPEVRKLTLDEFAESINDGCLDLKTYWVRYIKN